MTQSQDFLSETRKKLYKILYLQLALIVVIAFLWGYFHDFKSAWSALCGGSAWFFPSLFFIWFGFKAHKVKVENEIPSSTAPEPFLASKEFASKLLKKICFAEVGKIFFSVILVIIFIKLLPLALLPFLSGYGGAILTVWLLPYVFSNCR